MSTPKPLVYLAAPYSSDPVGNTRQAIESGMDLWQSGLVAVVIPHLSLLSDLVRPMSSADWYRFDLDIVEHCDAVLRLDGDSVGADVEVDCAHQRGIPVFTERAELFVWAGRWTPAGTDRPLVLIVDIGGEDVPRPSITCPRCGRTSYNRNDIASGYCGACHDWTSKAAGPQ